MFKYNFVLIFLITAKKVHSEITIDITNSDGNVSVNYTGVEVSVISDSDEQLFKVYSANLIEACNKYLGREPDDVYLKSPTPWGDLYSKYKWEQTTKVISIESATVKESKQKKRTITTRGFENSWKYSIKVHSNMTGHDDNTISSTWPEFDGMNSQHLNAKVTFTAGNVRLSTAFDYGKDDEASQPVDIGNTGGIGTELAPGKSVTAVLSANVTELEVEVIYKAKLRGNVAVNYETAHVGHHFWGPSISDVMAFSGITNEVTMKQIIKCLYYTDPSLDFVWKENNDEK